MRDRRGIGLNLGLRLYLLLVAILLPTFFVYYVQNRRTLETLHDRQVDDTVRSVTARVANRLDAYRSLRDVDDRDRDGVLREIQAVLRQPVGIDSVTVFAQPEDGELEHFAGFGAYESFRAGREEQVAASSRTTQRVDVRQGGLSYAIVSAPVFADGRLRGVAQMHILADRLTQPGDLVATMTGRIGEWLKSYGPDHTRPDGERLTRELQTLVEQPLGLESLSVFLRSASGDLEYLVGIGPFATTRASAEDITAAAKRSRQTQDPETGSLKPAMVSEPLLTGTELRAVVQVHAMPRRLNEPDDLVGTVVFRIGQWLEAYRSLRNLKRDGDVLTRELRRIVEEPTGAASLAVFFLESPDASPEFLTGVGPFVTTRLMPEDLAALKGEAVRRPDVTRLGVRYVCFSAPVSVGPDVRAIVQMYLLPEKIGLSEQLPAVRASLVVGAAVMLLIVGLGVAFFFQVLVRRPISDLTHAMGQATEGNLNVIVDSRGAEFGWLVTSFNSMIRQLKGTIDENQKLLSQIKGFNEDLKKRVAAATEELAAKNAQLTAVNERLFEMQRQVTRQEKLATLGQVAAIIAHELGTPLNAISGHLQLMLQEPVGDAQVMERLRVIDGQVDRLAAIVRDVLKAMRVPPPRFDTVDVNAVVREVAELVTPVAQKRGISLAVRVDRSLPSIKADAGQVQQVLMNLFTNAMDAMEKGGQISATTSAAAVEELPRDGVVLSSERHVRLDVRDTGSGLDAEAMTRAFEPFHTTKRPEDSLAGMGLGLGLAICRQIVRNHQGDIIVESEPGKGTRFSIFLPVDQPSMAAVRA